ncbi:MAG: AGE family epimerase/isomerase [Oscillospiraceae bacterium]|nr:AGE family epimerase/isomerase [Oscillospiraceae bacterium]
MSTKVKRPKQSFNVSDVELTAEMKKGGAPSYDIEKLIKAHLEPEVWKEHIDKDLMKFWRLDDARKLQGGLFPTYRCNKGKILDENNLPPEIKAALADDDTKGLVDLEHNYVRAHSRQTFAYGIAYNVTGNLEYLQWCKQGAEALMEAFDGEKGMFTKQNIKSGKWGDKVEERDAQNLAYGITGLGMYYYLTRDEKTLFKILQAKENIFKNYFSHGRGYFTWLPKASKAQIDDKVEIVAQLDQIYAYMIWLTPALPEPYQSDWRQSLIDITNILITRFYSERYGFFWGTGTENAAKRLGTAHTDFGHSIKTMWLIYQVGVMSGEMSFVNFARGKMHTILENAYLKDGTWARRYDEKGNIDKDKEWWSFAEMNQACAILALNDPSYLSYLNNTYDYWFKYMVDKEYGEIHHFVAAGTNKPDIKFPKIHAWKTSLHSFEHALFGYLTASQIKNKPSTLYYAFKSVDDVTYDRVHPYLFRANITDVSEEANIGFMENGNKKIKVGFYALH